MDKRVNCATLTPIGSELELEVSVELGGDGTLVLWIDTPDLPEDEKGPVLRVYLNSGDDSGKYGAIYENPPYKPWEGAESNGKH